MSATLAAVLGALAGGLAGAWLWARERRRERRAVAERQEARQALAALQIEHLKLTERVRYEEQIHNERLASLRDAQKTVGEMFKGLSQEALQRNNELFLGLAKERLANLTQGASAELAAREQAIAHLVGPVVERLNRVDALLGQLEVKRESAYQSLTDQVKALIESHLPRLHRETANLVRALREPAARGRWGELQLRRVVEMAGMLDHCDFIEQAQRTGEEGRILRPDLVVKLPGGRHVVVDAKAPVDAYLTAVEADDETVRASSLKRHAAQVRTHLGQLAKKAYWEQFPRAPEFVVMFVPGEVFFSAALREDPSLIETGVDQKVIPASPTTLIALLRAVSYGWQQDAIARNAEEIAALGRELYKRVALLGRGWSDTGAKLAAAVQAYNKTVGTLEARVLPQARRFRDLRAGDEEEIAPLDVLPEEARPLSAPEFAGPASPDE